MIPKPWLTFQIPTDTLVWKSLCRALPGPVWALTLSATKKKWEYRVSRLSPPSPTRTQTHTDSSPQSLSVESAFFWNVLLNSWATAWWFYCYEFYETEQLRRIKNMDSDSDSPFNYSWPSFPKMRIRRRTSKAGNYRVRERERENRSAWMMHATKTHTYNACIKHTYTDQKNTNSK